VARVTVDFSDVQEFEAVDKGEYDAIVEKVEMRPAEDTGKEFDYLNWEFTCTEGGDLKNRKFWLVTSFSPKALFRMKEVFENLGLPSDEVEIDYDEDTMQVLDPELAGLPCRVVISQETYEGRVQNRVDAVLSADTPAQGAKKTGTTKRTTTKRAATKRTPAKRAASGRKFK